MPIYTVYCTKIQKTKVTIEADCADTAGDGAWDLVTEPGTHWETCEIEIDYAELAET
jgi:hypothetical protein